MQKRETGGREREREGERARDIRKTDIERGADRATIET